MLKSMQGKEDLKATPPFTYVLLLAWGSQVIFDLTIASASLQRILREGLRPYNYQAIAYGIGFKQRKIFSYLLKRWYYEFWIDCRLCEMIAHGSSTVIIFSSKGFAAKNQKIRATPFVCLSKMFKCFGHQFPTEVEA